MQLIYVPAEISGWSFSALETVEMLIFKRSEILFRVALFFMTGALSVEKVRIFSTANIFANVCGIFLIQNHVFVLESNTILVKDFQATK